MDEGVILDDASASGFVGGKAPIEKEPFDSQEATVTAVVLGQADAFSVNYPAWLYATFRLKGKIQLAARPSRFSQ